MTDTQIDTIVNWLITGGAFAIGAGIMKVLYWFASRKDKIREAESERIKEAQDNLIETLKNQLEEEKEAVAQLRQDLDALRKEFDEKMTFKIDQYTEAISKAASAEASNVELRKSIETLQEQNRKLEIQLTTCRGE